MTAGGDIDALLARVVPPCASVAWSSVGAREEDDLWPEETHLAAGARPERRREFAGGRRCARRAMVKLGVEPAAISAGIDRAPRWPPGVVGSIAHVGPLCVAVVARTDALRAVGIDIERTGALSFHLAARVLRHDERTFDDSAEELRAARLVFCIKEAVYKCQYSVTAQRLSFYALRVSLDRASRSFTATFCRDAGVFRTGDTIAGAWDVNDDMIGALAACPT